MLYSKGHKFIAIERIDGFGKRKGLWIGEGNQLLKVATFGNDEKADAFERFLREFFGHMLVRKEDIGEDEMEWHN